jgi:amino acid transporter
VTSLLAYNVVKLGIRYPSQGGLIEYLRQGFGNGRLLGVASWLGYAAAFVVVAGMLAVSFGAYATTLFLGDNAWSGWDNVFASLVIVVMTVVNMIGATFVARAASVMVVVLLCVFAVFIVVTIKDVNWDLLAFSGYPSFSKIIASIALTFFAFLGFGVMTFTVANLRDPERELPRAVALALGLTTATYVLIAIGVFGTLTVNQAIAYGETAIAEAARPSLGDAGFTLMAVAALIATAGATNGTLFGSASLTGSLAEIGQFPPLLGAQSRLGKHGGLLVTSVLALLLANFVDLSAIASVGSACSLVVFLLVGIAGYRLRASTGASAAIVLLGIAVTAVVLGFFAVDTLRNAPETFVAIVAMTLLAFVLDVVWKRVRDRGGGPAATSVPSESL